MLPTNSISSLTEQLTALAMHEKPPIEKLQPLAEKIASLTEETFKAFVQTHSSQEQQLLIFRLRHGIGVDMPSANKPKHLLVERLREERSSPALKEVDSLMYLVDKNQKERLLQIFSKAGPWISDIRIWLERLLASQDGEKRTQALRAIAQCFEGLPFFTGDTSLFLASMAPFLEQIPVEHWKDLLTSQTNPLLFPKTVELCLPLLPQYETRFGKLVDTICRANGNFSDDVISHAMTIAKMIKSPHKMPKVMQSLGDCPESRRSIVTLHSVQILAKLKEPDRFVELIISLASELADEELNTFDLCFLPDDTSTTAHAILSRLQKHREKNHRAILTIINKLRKQGVHDVDLAKKLLIDLIENGDW